MEQKEIFFEKKVSELTGEELYQIVVRAIKMALYTSKVNVQ